MLEHAKAWIPNFPPFTSARRRSDIIRGGHLTSDLCKWARRGRSSLSIRILASVSRLVFYLYLTLRIMTGPALIPRFSNADDGMAILTAMNSEEVDIIGLTTVFGNVYTPTATRNAFKLLEIAGRTQVLSGTSKCCLWLLASACEWLLASACVPHEQTRRMNVTVHCHKASSSLHWCVC